MLILSVPQDIDGPRTSSISGTQTAMRRLTPRRSGERRHRFPAPGFPQPDLVLVTRCGQCGELGRGKLTTGTARLWSAARTAVATSDDQLRPGIGGVPPAHQGVSGRNPCRKRWAIIPFPPEGPKPALAPEFQWRRGAQPPRHCAFRIRLEEVAREGRCRKERLRPCFPK